MLCPLIGFTKGRTCSAPTIKNSYSLQPNNYGLPSEKMGIVRYDTTPFFRFVNLKNAYRFLLILFAFLILEDHFL